MTQRYDRNGTIGKIEQNYYNGMYIYAAQKTMLDNFTIMGLFPTIEVPTKHATIYEEEPITKYLDKIPQDDIIAKGASARKFRGEVTSPKGHTLESHQIEYTFDVEDTDYPGFNLTREVQAMSLILSTAAEKTVLDVMEANARQIEVGNNKDIKGKWATADYDKILDDIIIMKKQLRDLHINRISNFIYGDAAITKLAQKSQVEDSRYEFQRTGFYVDDTMQISNSYHSFGGTLCPDNACYGFNPDMPPLDILYCKCHTPGVTGVPAVQGMEKITPLIEMRKIDNIDEEFTGQYTIKMRCTVGAFPRQDGQKMIKIPNILS